MPSIRSFIATRQGELASHALLRRLREGRSLDELVRLAPALAFWAMAYQDLLRLNERRVGDPELRRIARHHRAEDSGHDRWFLADLETLTGGPLDLRGVFAKANAATRDATYELIAELYRAESDLERLVILLAIESVAHLFFAATAECADRTAVAPLAYFSRQHIESERRHEMWEEHVALQLDVLDAGADDDQRRRLAALVERIYAAFWGMLDGLAAAVVRDEAPAERPRTPSSLFYALM